MNNLLGEKYDLMTRLRTTYNTVKRIPKDMARSNFELKAVISFHDLVESNIVKEQNIDTKNSFYMVIMIQWYPRASQ